MGKKIEKEENVGGIQDIFKVVLSIVLIVGMFVVANVIANKHLERELAHQYQTEIVVE